MTEFSLDLFITPVPIKLICKFSNVVLENLIVYRICALHIQLLGNVLDSCSNRKGRTGVWGKFLLATLFRLLENAFQLRHLFQAFGKLTANQKYNVSLKAYIMYTL